jgi:hypothetical protein
MLVWGIVDDLMDQYLRYLACDAALHKKLCIVCSLNGSTVATYTQVGSLHYACKNLLASTCLQGCAFVLYRLC